MRDDSEDHHGPGADGDEQGVSDEVAAEVKQIEVKVEDDMTYDDYIKQTANIDKIIEIDEDTKWDKLRDFVGEYLAWMAAKTKRYTPVVKAKAASLAKVAYQKQPINKALLERWARGAREKIKPLESKFGAKNVLFGGITGITVLVLGGGFFIPKLFSGESGQVQSAVDVAEDLNIGNQIEPTFDVAVTDTVNKDQGIYFDPEVGVASYRDIVRGFTVTVSQQPLTDVQRADPAGELEKLAVQLLAGVSFETDLGTVYLTTPAPEGDPSQVAMFMTNDLLIFIRTAGVSISTEGWVEYINRIQA